MTHLQPTAPAAEVRAAGRAARKALPRSEQALYSPHERDLIALVEAQHTTRLERLLALRVARMAQSPFALFRGTAAMMAHDLRGSPTTGQHVVACGDAHIANFGLFATPERRLTFELNDFDEASTAPWEWDVKRLATSVVLAARERGAPDSAAARDAAEAVGEYQRTLGTMTDLPALERTHYRVGARTLASELGDDDAEFIEQTRRRARRRTSANLLPRITTETEAGRLRIVDEPPILTHLPEYGLDLARELLGDYLMTTNSDSSYLLRQFKVVDIAFRVVGVGSVGTRCMIVLLTGPMDEPLFLQIKEAGPSVLETFGGEPNLLRSLELPHRHNDGFRVITGQRILQTASDPFLGFLSHDGVDYYVRQFRDMKGSIELESLDERRFNLYVRYCGALLARGHAQSPAAPFIRGYLGSGDGFARAIASWATAYAAQVEIDFAMFTEAVASGRLPSDVA